VNAARTSDARALRSTVRVRNPPEERAERGVESGAQEIKAKTDELKQSADFVPGKGGPAYTPCP
jgi:hypothetical protein